MCQPVLHHRLCTRTGLRIVGQPDRGTRCGAGIQRRQAAVERSVVHAQRQQHDRPHPASVVVGAHSLALAGYRPGCTRHPVPGIR
ncbi:hypothetical protein G6F56_014591 [Rhizopus delemar]|nr:hypothetical protein G6F56_014591 [Rhizopus delemar]